MKIYIKTSYEYKENPELNRRSIYDTTNVRIPPFIQHTDDKGNWGYGLNEEDDDEFDKAYYNSQIENPTIMEDDLVVDAAFTELIDYIKLEVKDLKSKTFKVSGNIKVTIEYPAVLVSDDSQRNRLEVDWNHIEIYDLDPTEIVVEVIEDN